MLADSSHFIRFDYSHKLLNSSFLNNLVSILSIFPLSRYLKVSFPLLFFVFSVILHQYLTLNIQMQFFLNLKLFLFSIFIIIFFMRFFLFLIRIFIFFFVIFIFHIDLLNIFLFCFLIRSHIIIIFVQLNYFMSLVSIFFKSVYF
jgi:hypothetical protein